jgi:hypothetical protein
MILRRGNQTEVPGENVAHCHPAHHKSHVNWPGTESETLRWKANDQQPGPSKAHHTCDDPHFGLLGYGLRGL